MAAVLPDKGPAYDELIGGREFVVLDIETTTAAEPETTAAPHGRGEAADQAEEERSEVVLPISVGVVVFLNGSARERAH